MKSWNEMRKTINGVPVGAATDVAVGVHGPDVMYAGYYTMVNGVPQDMLTPQGLQSIDVSQNWANGIDVGISMVGSAGIGIAARASVLGGKTTAVSTYFLANDGVVAPGFGQIGLGVQYKASVNLGVLIDRGILREVR